MIQTSDLEWKVSQSSRTTRILVTIGFIYKRKRCTSPTWTASGGRCSTLDQMRAASWRQCVSCDQSSLRLCLVEASLASLAPLIREKLGSFKYTYIFYMFLIMFYWNKPFV